LGYAGIITGDVVNVGGSVALTNKNVGSNKPTTGTLLLDGADAKNYILNGIQYEVTPKALTVSGLTADSKVYDGTTTATAAGTPTIGMELVTGDVVAADLSTINVAFLDKNVGNSKNLQVTGNVLTGTDAGNYRAILSATADITPRSLTITGVGADNKVYDGTTTATKVVTGVPSLSGGIIAGDDISVNMANLAVEFVDKNVGTAKSLLVTGASMSGTDAGNYRVSVQNASADITKRDITVAVTAQNKVYDGTTVASVVTMDDRISGDVLSISGSANFADKNVGAGKVVGYSGISLTGSDAGNYTANIAATSSADITKRNLAVAVTALNKVYDGTAAASVTITDDRISGDVLTISGSANFADKNAGAGKVVSYSGVSLSGTDAGNYNANSVGTSSADITKRDLTVVVTAQTKVYDGTTAASVATADDRINGDVLTISGSAQFADKNAGAGKVVNYSGISLNGSDSGNYNISAAASGAADITKAHLTVTADDKARVYGDVNPDFTLTLSGFVSGENLSTSGVTGVGGATVNATTASGIGAYAVTPTVNTLSAQNYDFSPFVAGNLQVTPRPMTVIANNVVRLAGDSNPDPLHFSTGQGGLVNGDAVASVAISIPAGSDAAVGGEVFALKPSNVSFANGSSANYDMHLQDGYMIVLPKPADLAKDNPATQNQAFFLELDPAQIAFVSNELRNQQSQFGASAPSYAPSLNGKVIISAPTQEPDEIRRLVKRLVEASQGDSSAMLASLRNQPVLLWHPAMPATLLNHGGAHD
jgi:hypothetical protein